MMHDMQPTAVETTRKPELTAFPVDAAEIPWIPLRDGLDMRPLCFLDDGYSLQLRLQPGTAIASHRHTGEVSAINLRGWRRILGTNELIGPGTFIHEPAGNVDSWACEGTEPCIIQISLKGRVEYLDAHGRVEDYSDTFSAMEAYLNYCDGRGREPNARLFRGTLTATRRVSHRLAQGSGLPV